jgi:hypothetical protein
MHAKYAANPRAAARAATAGSGATETGHFRLHSVEPQVLASVIGHFRPLTEYSQKIRL